ncbi:acyltransferase [Pseudarthrobacter sp. GA104]|uniref:acyltransferase family protein n=1 Tax=Pseudarthrobacter sp. GA104 TaxID=2676311 RepID=UPI0012FA49A7|nr:acyltransferase [Pseudarthrobacter sp. GA104]MUU72438.1 acyltransferase family protein [Pseudarthrobacter sp. GA104]
MSDDSSDKSRLSRDLSLDALRGALVFFVLVLHAEMISGIGRTSVVGYLNMSVGPVLMPLFFVISGYLARNGLRRDWTDFLYSQVLRLLWPFLIWGVIYSCFVSLVEEKLPLNAGLLVKLVLQPTELGPIWYLHFLLTFLVLARITRGVSAVAMTALFVISAVATTAAVGSSPTILIHASSFFLGLSLARYPELLHWLGERHVGRSTFLAATFAFLASSPLVAADSLRDNAWALPLVLLTCIVLISCRRVLENAVGSKWMIWIGVNSLPIYLIHWPVMLIVWRITTGTSSLQSPEVFWLALTMAMVVGSLVADLANRRSTVAILFAPPQIFSKAKLRSYAFRGRSAR